jgi:hypothetical protein
MMRMIVPVATLSPGFARARKLSRFVAVLFALGFLVMLSVALSGVWCVFYPTTPSGVSHGIGFMNGFGVSFGSLTHWQAIGAMVATELTFVPTVLVLYHMCRLFSCFAKGEVFAARTIAHLRAAGYWLTASFFTGIAAVYLLVLIGVKQGLLSVVAAHFSNSLPSVAIRFNGAIFTGLPIIIAAYVMEEARRIAADHAEIV